VVAGSNGNDSWAQINQKSRAFSLEDIAAQRLPSVRATDCLLFFIFVYAYPCGPRPRGLIIT